MEISYKFLVHTALVSALLGFIGGWYGKTKEVKYVQVPVDHQVIIYKDRIVLVPGHYSRSGPQTGSNAPSSQDDEQKNIIIYVPPEGKVTVDPGGKLSIQRYGFTFEPGLTYSPFQHSVGLDAKFAYWNRFGIVGGIVYGHSQHDTNFNFDTGLTPLLGISYRLDKLYLPNTEAVLSYAPMYRSFIFLGGRINL
jgi:hypothetical protein